MTSLLNMQLWLRTSESRMPRQRDIPQVEFYSLVAGVVVTFALILLGLHRWLG